MNVSTYFVRSRGHVSGPFTFEVLKKLSTRGAVSRFDEVSEDQRNWKPIDSVDGLFEKISLPTRASHQQTSPSESVSPAPVMGSTERRYFYSQNGKTIGPLESSVLRSLAASRVIGPKDLVWVEGDEVAYEAAQSSLLAGIFTRTPAAKDTLNESLADEKDSMSDVLARNLPTIAFLSGLSIGLLQLLTINTLFWKHKEQTIFWWNDQSGFGFLFGIYINISAILTVILSSTSKNLTRSIPIFILATIPIPGILIHYLIYEKFQLVPVMISLAILSPIFTFMMAINEVARCRSSTKDYRAISVVFGIICVISYFSLGITIFTAIFRALEGNSVDLEPIAIFVIISVILLGITPGILSLLSGLSPRILLTKFTVLASVISLSSFAIPTFFLLVGIGYKIYDVAVTEQNIFRKLENMQGANQFVLKNLVIACGYIVLIGTSFLEMLLSKNGKDFDAE